MRIFVTGASGHLGLLLAADLIQHGHQVDGLARSEAGARRIEKLGGTAVRATLADVDVLRAAASRADAVAHLAYRHDAAQADAASSDRAVVAALTAELAGSGRPLVVTSGTAGMAPGQILSEYDAIDPATAPERFRAEGLALGASGVRTSVVRLAPTVHGPADGHGFIPSLVAVARQRGVSAFIADGSARWPAVHEDDAATLFRLAIEQAHDGVVLHGIAEEGVPYIRIAEAIGELLDLPVTGISQADAAAHFGWLGALVGLDMPARSDQTRAMLGWAPSSPRLLSEIASGDAVRAA